MSLLWWPLAWVLVERVSAAMATAGTFFLKILLHSWRCCCRRCLSARTGWRAFRSSGSTSRWSKGELASCSEADTRELPGGLHGAVVEVPRTRRCRSSSSICSQTRKISVILLSSVSDCSY